MITNGQQQYQQANNNVQFIDLNGFRGSGEVGRYVDDHTGVLVGIRPRGGTYKVTDRRTGQTIERPNSWTAVFEDGNMVSWPTYQDKNTGAILPWSRFDQSIDLQACVAQRRVIHLWHDEKKFFHLEVIEEQANLNPLPIMSPASMQAAPAPAPAPAPMMMNPVNMPTQEPWRQGQVYGNQQ